MRRRAPRSPSCACSTRGTARSRGAAGAAPAARSTRRRRRPGRRQVDPVERPIQRRRERVRDLDELAAVRRDREVAVIVVAVAEVEPELDVRGHVPAEAQQPLEHAGANLAEPSGRDALEHRELQSRVPLERELIVRDRRPGSRRPPRGPEPRRSARSPPGRSPPTNALIGASGVGSETWKRTRDGMTSSRLSSANVR